MKKHNTIIVLSFRTIILLVSLISASLPSIPAVAQQTEFFNLFAGALAAAQEEEAAKAWQRLSPVDDECVDRFLKAQGSSVSQIAEAGVTPDDPRLAPIRAQCAQFRPGALRQNYGCTISDDSGSPIQTRCNQTFARRNPDGSLTPISPTDAISLQLAGTPAVLEDVETDAARSARIDTQQEAAERARQTEAWQSALNLLNDARSQAHQQDADQLPANFQQRLASIDQQYQLLVQTSNVQASVAIPRSPPRSSNCSTPTPLWAVLCTHDDLRWLALDYYRSYHILTQLFPENQPALLKEETKFFSKLVAQCTPTMAAVTRPQLEGRAIVCLRKTFAAGKSLLDSKVRKAGVVSAIQELSRPIAEHFKLQQALQNAGYLDQSLALDGIYRTQTRSAIQEFQKDSGFEVTGFISDETANKLLSSENRGDPAKAQVVTNDYNDYVADLNNYRQSQKTIRLRAGRVAKAQKVLSGFVPETLRAFLAKYVSDNRSLQGDDQMLADDDQKFSTIESQLDIIMQVQAELIGRSSFLTSGADNDIILLYNSNSDATGVTRALDGKIIFSQARLRTCSLLGGDVDTFTRRLLSNKLQSLGVLVPLSAMQCDLKQADSYDLLVLRRSQLLSESPGDILEFVKAVDGNSVSELSQLTVAEVAGAKSQQAATVRQIEANIQAHAADGDGVIVLANGSNVVCIASQGDLSTDTVALEKHLDDLTGDLGKSPTYVMSSAEDAFVAAKRAQCGAVFGNASDLGELASGFDRDGVQYHFAPMWITSADLQAAQVATQQRQAAAAERATDQARQAADQAALAAANASQRQAIQEAQQAKLRQQYGSMANAFELRLAAESEAFASNGDARLAGSFSEKYPDIASMYEQLLEDHWEFMSIASHLDDYGTAQFKGRTLEAGLIVSNIKLRNRILGEYKTICIETGFLNDSEFQMDRDPIGVECQAGSVAIENYKRGERFNSRWLVSGATKSDSDKANPTAVHQPPIQQQGISPTSEVSSAPNPQLTTLPPVLNEPSANNLSDAKADQFAWGSTQSPSPSQGSEGASAAVNSAADANAKTADEISQLINNAPSAAMTQSEISMLVAQIHRCWRLFPNQIESRLTAELDFKLNQDGTVNGTPKIVSADSSDMGQQIAQSAQRAVLDCQPYRLPAANYAAWSEIDLVMNPAD